jgi:DNA-binding MarR family transcriptional regulator
MSRWRWGMIRFVDDDQVDSILGQWRRERPDVDVGGMSVIARVSRLERLISARLDEVFAAHGLESWEFDLLATLRRHGAPFELTPGQLLSSMMISTGAVTNRIDRLQQRGLVKRVKHPTDGRLVLVRLTARGLKKVDGALVDHAANELRLIAGLDADDRVAIVDLLKALAASVIDAPQPSAS